MHLIELWGLVRVTKTSPVTLYPIQILGGHMILEGLLENGQLHCKVYGKMDMEKSGSETSGLIYMHSLYWYQNNTLHSQCIEL